MAGVYSLFSESVKNKDVIEFYKWLKDQYEEAGDYASLEEIYHLGYHGEGYWVLSDHVSIFTMSIQCIRDSFGIFSVYTYSSVFRFFRDFFDFLKVTRGFSGLLRGTLYFQCYTLTKSLVNET